MALTCPHCDYAPQGEPKDQVEQFLVHLGVHYPTLSPLFTAISAMMKSLPISTS